MTRHVRLVIIASAATTALFFAHPALAGPPLLCHPFDIGAARSLPMARGGWQAVDPTYDVLRLVADTLAILSPIE